MYLCDVRDEDLLAFEDGYLEGGRRELVEAHLRACPFCQERLAAFREVDAILRASGPVVDPQASRRDLLRRLQREEQSTPILRSAKPLVLVAALVLLAIAIWPGTSGADFPLDRAIRFGAVQIGRVVDTADGQSDRNQPSGVLVGTIAVGPVDTLPGSRNVIEGVATAPVPLDGVAFDTVEPQQLPLGLRSVERGQPAPTRIEVLYRNADGMSILLTESPAEPNTVVVEPFDGAAIQQIGDTAVLVLADPRPNAVAGMVWERGGIVFELFVVDAPPDGLKLADALSVVEALSEAQSR